MTSLKANPSSASNGMTGIYEEQLILEHLSLVKSIALRLHMGLPNSVDLGDLEQAGTLGLIAAARRYDASSNIAFGTFAKHRIRGAMLDSLRQSDWASRKLRTFGKALENVSRELTATLNRPPTEAELAEGLGIAVAALRKRSADLHNVGIISASGLEEDNPIDLPAPAESSAHHLYARKEYEQLVRNALAAMPARQQTLLRKLFYEEHSQKEVSLMFGIHESRISQIRTAALQQMGLLLKAQGVHSSVAA